MAYATGKRIVEMVEQNLRPSDVMTREAFINAIVVASAIGASTNCPPHMIAIARHMGVELTNDDWQTYGHELPLLVNLQPAGEYLGEAFHRAGGVPAVMKQMLDAGHLNGNVMTVSGRTVAENLEGVEVQDRNVIRPLDDPLMTQAGFLVMGGNLFDSAIMKTSVIGKTFRDRYLSNPDDPNAFEGKAIVFEGPEDYHDRINDPSLEIDAHSLLFIRGCGPVGYPGSAEVVNMLPPDDLVKQGVTELPTIGDGRQSGTSGSPSILNASPESAVGGGLMLLKTGDRIRIDLSKRTVDMLVDEAELERRRAETAPHYPEDQTPWQHIYRSMVGQLAEGACLEPATLFLNVAETKGLPRDSH